MRLCSSSLTWVERSRFRLSPLSRYPESLTMSSILLTSLYLLHTACFQAEAGFMDWDPLCEKGCKEFLKPDNCCPSTTCRGDTFSKLFKSSTHYRVIQDCPQQDGHIKMLCEKSNIDVTTRLDDLLPVTSRGITFFNKHCALCYNISDHVNWSLNITCESYVAFQNLPSHQAIFDKALGTFYCSVKMAPPAVDLVEKCYTSLQIPLLAHENTFTPDEVFASDLAGNVKSYHGAHGKPFVQKSRNIVISRKAPLSIILNFNPDAESTPSDVTPGPEQNHNNCSATQWRHKFEESCLPVRCAKGKQLVESRCVSVINDIKGLMYRYILTVASSVRFHTDRCSMYNATSSLVKIMVDRLKTDSYKCTVKSRMVRHNDSNEDVSREGSAQILEATLACQIVVTQTVSRDEYEKDLLKTLDTNWNLTCGELELELELVPNRYTTLKGDEIGSNVIPVSQIFAGTGETYFDFNDPENEFTKVSPFMVCRYVLFNVTQYKRDNSTGCITIDAGRVSFCHDEFDISEDKKALVCVDTLNEKNEIILHESSTETSIHITTQFYLSYACISLSMACLLITFIIYLIFPSLRSLPAKNNICLVFNLFWAQALLQFGIHMTDNRLICQTLGVLIHFFWLSALLSMNVCSYHMYSVFSYHKMAMMPRHSSTKRLVKYLSYTYIVSASIVAATISSQHISSGGQTIGYGERYCYLTSATLIGFAFALPLGIILTLNVIMFVLAIRSIAQTSRIESEVLSRGRHNLHVYIKLSTLTGLFWIFGILAELIQNEALTYLSIVLNGSQGIFIFIACVCNMRVLRLIKCTKKTSVQISSSDKTKSTNTKGVSLHEIK